MKKRVSFVISLTHTCTHAYVTDGNPGSYLLEMSTYPASTSGLKKSSLPRVDRRTFGLDEGTWMTANMLKYCMGQSTIID